MGVVDINSNPGTLRFWQDPIGSLVNLVYSGMYTFSFRSLSLRTSPLSSPTSLKEHTLPEVDDDDRNFYPLLPMPVLFLNPRRYSVLVGSQMLDILFPLETGC